MRIPEAVPLSSSAGDDVTPAVVDSSVAVPGADSGIADGGVAESGGPDARAAALLSHPTLAVATTERGRIRDSNAAWKSLFALPDDVSVESHAASLFANVAAADRFERLLQTQLGAPDAATSDDAGGTRATVDHALTRRDGTSFVGEVTVWLSDATQADHPLCANAIWQVRDISAEHALKRELRDLEVYHRELSRHQWGMTFVLDRKGRISYASPSVEETLGFPAHTLLGESFMALLDPQHAASAGQWLRGITSRHRGDPAPDGHRLRVVDQAGKVRLVACRPRNCFEVPQIAGMVVHAHEVEEAEAADGLSLNDGSLQATLAEVAAAPAATGTIAERITRLLDALREALGASVAVFRATGDGGLTVASPAGRFDKRPRPPDDIRLRVVRDTAAEAALSPETVASFAAASIAALIEAPVWTTTGASGGSLAVGASAARDWTDAEVGLVVATAQAIALTLPQPTSTQRAVAGGDATVDALTGLPDRASARRWLDREAAAHASAGTLTLLCVDLDRFQDVNDLYGHAAGDTVIARAAGIIADVVGDAGYVARVGGDEFIVVLTNATTRTVEETNAMLLKRIASVEDEMPRVEASIGTARLPGDAQDAATLWLHADLAMREAKKRGRGQAFVFDPRIASAVRVRKALDVEIADALERDEFALFFQPQIALATGKVVGLEALLRWQHPVRGLLLPDVFIDAAVECGLIEAITKSVVGKVCEQIASWRRGGAFPELPVGVNVAGTQFHDRRLPALVASALLRSGLPARLLVLELGEQTLVGDAVETERVVKELSRLGVRTAVGGFALGHGALKQLRQLRVAQIKVDRGFVGALPDDEPSSVVVGTMIDIGKRLKCQVIAEGVETRAQFELLRSLGCEAGQGFFFGAPLSPDETRVFVENNLEHPVR